MDDAIGEQIDLNDRGLLPTAINCINYMHM